jgi:hypothetical protein
MMKNSPKFRAASGTSSTQLVSMDDGLEKAKVDGSYFSQVSVI